MSDKKISELEQAQRAQAGDLIPFARDNQTLSIELTTLISLAKGEPGKDGKDWAPDGYGPLTDLVISSIEGKGVPYIYLVNPNSDNRSDLNEPPALSGDQSGKAIGWSPKNGWVSYGPIVGMEGPPGAGVPSGGAPGQILEKLGVEDFQTRWVNKPQASWGAVSGNLQDQEDLVVVLGGKASTKSNKFTGVQTFGSAIFENRVQLEGGEIDLTKGNYFTLSASGPVELSLVGAPDSGSISVFVLDVRSTGSTSIDLWGGVVWADGSSPSLTKDGRDVLGFIVSSGGVSSVGVVISKDAK